MFIMRIGFSLYIHLRYRSNYIPSVQPQTAVRSHELLFNYVIVTAGYRMCLCPDSTDVPTIYWRVNSSSLDGALLLDFSTQGPSYELFIHIGLRYSD